MRLALRFRRGQARTLDAIAKRCSSDKRAREQQRLFNQAAHAARTGEPMIVECDDRAELERLADGFPIWGAARPTIEQPRFPEPAPADG